MMQRSRKAVAVIVSTARTPIGKAYRGAFNDTQAQALGGHVIAEAVRRAGVAPGVGGMTKRQLSWLSRIDRSASTNC